MRNPDSPLASRFIPSPHCSHPRTHAIDSIAIHCMAADATAEGCGAWFQNPAAQASSNYGIGSDGMICQYVAEEDRSWCTSSRECDNRAITIEVANRPAKHPWAITDAAYRALVDLCEDICRRNGIPRLVWSDNKDDRVNHRNGANMKCHRDYANKACPGDYIYALEPRIAAEVNARLADTPKEDDTMTKEQFDRMFADAMVSWQGELQDNDAHEYSEPAREWAIDNGIIQGTGNGTDGKPNYAWEANVTREQLITILYRMTHAPNDDEANEIVNE